MFFSFFTILHRTYNHHSITAWCPLPLFHPGLILQETWHIDVTIIEQERGGKEITLVYMILQSGSQLQQLMWMYSNLSSALGPSDIITAPL